MKELRFKANHGAEIWRAVFAFDPNHDAIILVAADKQGIDEKKFYKNLLTKANRRFDQHLKSLKAAGSHKVQVRKREEIGDSHGKKSGRCHQ
ncbi:type II toxin-antitoxin system RelE/ParE family toxin [Massilia sp. H-1]|nr:type II toxin-antitoxin system RelE/ParE family toxin [Massilia sp. H-1]